MSNKTKKQNKTETSKNQKIRLVAPEAVQAPMDPFSNINGEDGLRSAFGFDPQMSSLNMAGEYNMDNGNYTAGARADIPVGSSGFLDPSLSAYLKARLGSKADIGVNGSLDAQGQGRGNAELNFYPTDNTSMSAFVDTDKNWNVEAQHALTANLKAKAKIDNLKNAQAMLEYSKGNLRGNVGVEDGPNRPNPYYSANINYDF